MITTLDKITALILIDLQKGIVSYPAAHPIEGVLANCAKLVAAFRKAGQPIIIVNVDTAGAAWTKSRKEPSPARPAPTAGWTEIVAEIKTEPTDVFITKHTWGAFFETALDEELKKRNVTGIVIGGVSTSRGVEGTARQASERGYNLTFVTDAMTDLIADAHANSVKYIFPAIGEIGNTEDVVALLQ
ncbi:isochorismatase family protein [Mucilaginibacter sp. UR6-11]|uniref:isochorismatase family protein n=1 Tax=Mucilaginibacter sp. UR6-11 TaxID=1435644 RepID=UPI001E48E8CA|nr:isochorismatase family protein [Mucilaginibacter sp. UR6-11]MCC8425619.1 isochorismatase family protein [Mucilaginibacter sp. UR6-11]